MIKDITLPVEENEYWNEDNYYLDDPYEGELVTQIVTVLSEDFTDAEVTNMWVDKRKDRKSVV